MTEAGRERWYVAQTLPLKEAWALENLSRKGFKTYLPRYVRERRHARKVEHVVRPLFPRYLFVSLDPGVDRWRSISGTFGVSRLLVAGDQPLALPPNFVSEMRARETPQGFVTLGLAPGLGIGSMARLTDGIFAEHVGVIERVADERRIVILLGLLGREVRTEIEASSLAAV